MSNENVNETTRTDSAGKTDAANKFGGKKWGIIGAIAVVLIALIIGIGLYNTPANRLARLLDLGNRYLEEQNYEQAIVEFDKAIAIDPMCVEAYLGKAEAYVGLGDLQAAADTLQIGYELTNDERLKAKLDEIGITLIQQRQAEEEAQRATEGVGGLAGMDTLDQPDSEGEETDENIMTDAEHDEVREDITLPINMTDVKIMGYDLMESHFYALIDAFGVTLETYYPVAGDPSFGVGADEFIGSTQYGFMMAYDHRGDWEDIGGDLEISIYNDNNIVDQYPWFSYASKPYEAVIVRDKNKRDKIEEICDLPLLPGDTYETWCETLGIEAIKSAVESETDENNSTTWDNIMDSQRIAFADGWYVEKYEEGESIDYNTNKTMFACRLNLRNDAGMLLSIWSEFEGDEIEYVHYMRY